VLLLLKVEVLILLQILNVLRISLLIKKLVGLAFVMKLIKKDGRSLDADESTILFSLTLVIIFLVPRIFNNYVNSIMINRY
jgi:hypothetical protein